MAAFVRRPARSAALAFDGMPRRERYGLVLPRALSVADTVLRALTFRLCGRVCQEIDVRDFNKLDKKVSFFWERCEVPFFFSSTMGFFSFACVTSVLPRCLMARHGNALR